MGRPSDAAAMLDNAFLMNRNEWLSVPPMESDDEDGHGHVPQADSGIHATGDLLWAAIPDHGEAAHPETVTLQPDLGTRIGSPFPPHQNPIAVALGSAYHSPFNDLENDPVASSSGEVSSEDDRKPPAKEVRCDAEASQPARRHSKRHSLSLDPYDPKTQLFPSEDREGFEGEDTKPAYKEAFRPPALPQHSSPYGYSPQGHSHPLKAASIPLVPGYLHTPAPCPPHRLARTPQMYGTPVMAPPSSTHPHATPPHVYRLGSSVPASHQYFGLGTAANSAPHSYAYSQATAHYPHHQLSPYHPADGPDTSPYVGHLLPAFAARTPSVAAATKPPPTKKSQLRKAARPPSARVAAAAHRPPSPASAPARAGGGQTRAGERTSQVRRSPTEEEVREARTPRAKAALHNWYARLGDLLEYKDRHGDCNVPQKYDPNPPLGIWVNKQRMEKKFLDEGQKSSMTPAKLRALEQAGFTWAKRKGDPSWNTRFDELLQYRDEHGHCDVPTKYGRNPALGRWVSTQRSQYKLWRSGETTQMNRERASKLNAIGFRWNMTSDRGGADLDGDNDSGDGESEGRHSRGSRERGAGGGGSSGEEPEEAVPRSVEL